MFSTYDNDDKSAQVTHLLSLIEQINAKVKEAEEYARSNELEFQLDYGYGARADYTRVDVSTLENFEIDYDKTQVITQTDEWDEEAEIEMAYGWMSSSMYCM